MNYLFIINPKSGVRHPIQKIISEIKTVFDGQSNHSYAIVYSEYAGHARKIAESAVLDDMDVVVAAGGDGTVNEVCSSLVDTNTSFGLIPMGSGNGFARSLNIPLNSINAVDCLMNGSINSIDVGKIGERYFFGVAGFSLDATIGAKFNTYGHRGPLPYFYLGLREFFNYQYEEFELTFEDKNILTKPLILTVANTSQYGNGASIAPQADYKDGVFDICIIEKLNFWDATLRLHYLFNNKIQSLSTYKSYRSNKIHIKRTDNSGYYHLDGEIFKGGAEFDIELLPGSLKVCC